MPPVIGRAWQLVFYELGGGLRARNDYLLANPALAPRAPGAPLAITAGTELLAVAPTTGDPLFRTPFEGLPFATVVDGAPLVGTVVGGPLRIIVFTPPPR